LHACFYSLFRSVTPPVEKVGLEKTQLIKNAKGRPVKAVLPFRAYRELVQLKISHEIYEHSETQEAIRNAKRDIASRRTHRFKNLAEAFRWLDE
jgi:hypothetical protein